MKRGDINNEPRSRGHFRDEAQPAGFPGVIRARLKATDHDRAMYLEGRHLRQTVRSQTLTGHRSVANTSPSANPRFYWPKSHSPAGKATLPPGQISAAKATKPFRISTSLRKIVKKGLTKATRAAEAAPQPAKLTGLNSIGYRRRCEAVAEMMKFAKATICANETSRVVEELEGRRTVGGWRFPDDVVRRSQFAGKQSGSKTYNPRSDREPGTGNRRPTTGNRLPGTGNGILLTSGALPFYSKRRDDHRPTPELRHPFFKADS